MSFDPGSVRVELIFLCFPTQLFSSVHGAMRAYSLHNRTLREDACVGSGGRTVEGELWRESCGGRTVWGRTAEGKLQGEEIQEGNC